MGVFDFIQNPSRPRYSGDEYYTLPTKDLSEDSPMRALALMGIPGALVYYAYAQPRTLLTALAGTLEELRLREARSLSGGFYSIMGGDTGAWLIAPIPVRHFAAETLSLSPSALLVGVDSATTDLVEKTLESISSCDKRGRTSLLRNKFGVEIVQGIVSVSEDEITGPGAVVDALRRGVTLPWWLYPGFEGTYDALQMTDFDLLPEWVHQELVNTETLSGWIFQSSSLWNYGVTLEEGTQGFAIIGDPDARREGGVLFCMYVGDADPQDLAMLMESLRRLGPYELVQDSPVNLVCQHVAAGTTRAEFEELARTFIRDFKSLTGAGA